jgi:septal ring factor EnvC (AmiA/AmiB activator)
LCLSKSVLPTSTTHILKNCRKKETKDLKRLEKDRKRLEKDRKRLEKDRKRLEKDLKKTERSEKKSHHGNQGHTSHESEILGGSGHDTI